MLLYDIENRVTLCRFTQLLPQYVIVVDNLLLQSKLHQSLLKQQYVQSHQNYHQANYAFLKDLIGYFE